MSLSGKMFGNVLGYKKMFLDTFYKDTRRYFYFCIYMCNKHFSPPHDTARMVYFRKFRPTEVPVCVGTSRQWSSVPQSHFSKISLMDAILLRNGSPSFFLWLL